MDRLRVARKQKGYTQDKLAEIIGTSRSTLAMWETNKSQPSNEMLGILSRTLGVSTDYLLGNDPQILKGVKIPVLGRVQAGIPIEAIEDILDYEEIEPELAETGEFFALQIKGDSMEPKFSEGDVVIVRRQPDVESGEIAVVLVNGDCATVKKIVKHANGISLVSSNAAYMPMFYTMQEIEDLPVEVLGKVIELRAKF